MNWGIVSVQRDQKLVCEGDALNVEGDRELESLTRWNRALL
jgi:hypothetical protein